MKYDVFVSYSRKDYVDESGQPVDGSPIFELLRFLDENKITYWIDKDGVYSGSEFMAVITDAITESKMLIFVSSQYSNASEYTAGEITEARTQKKLIVPFKIDDSPYNKKYRIGINYLDYIEYYSNPQLAFASLLKTINTCKKEYEELLLEEQRKKAEADARRRIAGQCHPYLETPEDDPEMAELIRMEELEKMNTFEHTLNLLETPEDDPEMAELIRMEELEKVEWDRIEREMTSP